ADEARPISRLVKEFEQFGNKDVNAHCDETPLFSADEWNSWGEAKQQAILLNYRIAYLSEAFVNWCPALGTVLANDEVKDGVSERGGYPVERKLMKQWSMRITAYSQRLLDGLEDLDWSESLKEQQRNWIGRSEGASIHFDVKDHDAKIEVFTTRPDTIFGVTFMTLAPEHELVAQITTPEQKAEIEAYIQKAKAKSERERMADVKTVSGAFTGAYAVHPFSGEPIPIWIGDYVLAGYGTGAVMAVPSGDQRDWNFAKHFGIPIPAVIEGSNLEEEANESKDGILMNSDFLNGMKVKDAIRAAIAKLEEKGIGKGKINYRQRDAVFGRQRYWGEPIPIYYKDGVPYPINKLPLELPEVEKYLPTEAGDPPLGNAENWNWDPEKEAIVPNGEGYPIELSTMPGWAGSSWYYLRYMDAQNDDAFVGEEAIKYWGNVDYYAGGAEHATGHLLYVRFWTKFLKDLGYLPFDEPAKKLVNQGMIQGVSAKVRFGVYQNEKTGKWVQFLLPADYPVNVYSDYAPTINYPVSHLELVSKGGKQFYQLSKDEHESAREEYHFLKDIEFFSEEHAIGFDEKLPKRSMFFDDIDSKIDDGLVEVKLKEYLQRFNELQEIYLGTEVEKMSKSKYNVVNPDDIIERYGADTLRLYEMFLGPLEDAKPWNTNGIEGVYRFLKKFWNLFYDGDTFSVSDEEPTKKELKALHATIKKVQEDIERLSFNTCVSQFMICVNELNDLKCNKRAILEPLTVVISTYAPHICEELWSILGHAQSITFAEYPAFNESHLVEDSISYPISFNGKTRLNLELPATMGKEEVEQCVLANEEVLQRLEGATPKKVIVVPKRIVNIVV
ncbi:MAG: leucine--tRNA ligase, partial [Flavobacteriales bacterium]|nr:leucine--tRNA ligase [Flavobacteriales bacterium]